MEAREARHPLATGIGICALALWALYLLLAAKNLPDLPHRVLISGSFGLLACLALLTGFRYWRGAVLLSLAVYLVTYVVLVGRMAMMATGGGASLPAAVSFYYSNAWVVTGATFHERGALDGIAHAFLEYGMPALSLILIVAILMQRRTR